MRLNLPSIVSQLQVLTFFQPKLGGQANIFSGAVVGRPYIFPSVFSFVSDDVPSKLGGQDSTLKQAHVSGAVVGMPCIFPSIVSGVNITTCTRIDGDEVQIMRVYFMQF